VDGNSEESDRRQAVSCSVCAVAQYDSPCFSSDSVMDGPRGPSTVLSMDHVTCLCPGGTSCSDWHEFLLPLMQDRSVLGSVEPQELRAGMMEMFREMAHR
jgi:hypothetical protein